MNRLYSTVPDVVESLEAAVEKYDEGTLSVVDSHPARAVALSDEEMVERGLLRDEFVCAIEFESVRLGEHKTTHLELSFHESEVDIQPFTLAPAGVSAMAPKQATSPLDLGERLGDALSPLVEEHDAIFTFKGVEAQSMANGGHFTDFEFEYAIDGVQL